MGGTSRISRQVVKSMRSSGPTERGIRFSELALPYEHRQFSFGFELLSAHGTPRNCDAQPHRADLKSYYIDRPKADEAISRTSSISV
jgi:hypothetical protein